MTLEEFRQLSVNDILDSVEFKIQAGMYLIQVFEGRNTARINAKAQGYELKAHPIDNLSLMGLSYEPNFTPVYKEVLAKVAKGYSSSERRLISEIGNTIFIIARDKILKGCTDYVAEDGTTGREDN